MSKKILINCGYCGVCFERYKSTIRDNQIFIYCCKAHMTLHQPLISCGVNNSNYGNTWNQQQRDHQSNIMQIRMQDPEERFKAGASNRGKKFSPERVEKMHGNRLPASYSRPHTVASKKLIGIKSSLKFIPEFREQRRLVMESIGKWIPLKDKSSYSIYFSQADWISRMWDTIINVDQLTLLQELKVFNCRTNTKGVVRDHIYSRLDGFNNGVFPEIIRHPCNCQIITHALNVSRAANKYQDRSKITLPELFYNIEQYTREWSEQTVVLSKIKEYNNGNRWYDESKI